MEYVAGSNEFVECESDGNEDSDGDQEGEDPRDDTEVADAGLEFLGISVRRVFGGRERRCTSSSF